MRSDDEDDPFFKKKEKRGQMMVLQKVLLRVQAPDIQKFSAEEKRMVLARILKMDPRERKEDEILNLKLLTQDLDFFTKINSKKYNQEAKLDEQICRRLKYESFSKGQTVIEFGAKADKFFILLSGEVSIFLAKSSDSIAEEEYSLPSRQFRKLTHAGLTNLQEEIDDNEGITSEQMILLQEQGNRSPQIGNQNRTIRDSTASQINSPMHQTGTPKYTKRFSMMALSPQAKHFGTDDRKFSLNYGSDQNNIEDHPLDKFCRKPSFQGKKQEETEQQQQQLNSPKQSSPFGESSPQMRRASEKTRLSIFNQKYESDFPGMSTPNSFQSNHNSFVKPKSNSRSSLVTQMTVQYDERSPNEFSSNKQHLNQQHRSSFQLSTIPKDDNQHSPQLDAMAALRQFQRNIQEKQLSNSHRLFQPNSEQFQEEQIQNPKNYRNFGKSIQQLSEELQQLDPINENPEQFLNQPLPSLQSKTSGDSSNSNSTGILQKSKSQKILDCYKTIQAFGNLHLSEIEEFERLFTDTGVFKFQYKDKLTEGSTFGELGILEGKPRSALIICSADSEFAIMEKDDYQELLAERDRKHLRQKFEFLKNHIFPDLTNDAIKKIFYTFQKKKYKMHDVVFAQGDTPNGVFIIIKGEMSLSQKLDKNDIADGEMRNMTDRGEYLNGNKEKDNEGEGGDDGSSSSDCSKDAMIYRNPRFQQQKRFSRTFAVIGMGEYFGEEDLLLKDNQEAQKRHYTAICHSIKASVYFIEAGFFMRFLKSKPNSQLIIEQRLAKKTQWRQHYKDRVTENIKLHGLLHSKQQQQALQTSTLSPKKSIETSSPQLFSCVPLSARTLQLFTQGSKSQQTFMQPTMNTLDSEQSKQIQLSTPPPSLSFLLRELKPLGPIPKAALALSTNQCHNPLLSQINCLPDSPQRFPKDILTQNSSQSDQKINNNSSISTGKSSTFLSTLATQSRYPSEPSAAAAGNPIIFSKLPRLPSSNKPYSLNTDRPSYSMGVTDQSNSQNTLNDPSSLTSRQEVSQQELISTETLRNEVNSIGSPKVFNSSSRHLFFAKHGQQDTPKNKDIQSSRSPKNSLMNMCLKKIKSKTDSIDSILRYDELKNSPQSKQTSQNVFFAKPNKSSNQIIDVQHQPQSTNSNIEKIIQTSLQQPIFQTSNKIYSPADQENTQSRKISSILSTTSENKSSLSVSPSKERIKTTSTTSRKMFFQSSNNENPVRVHGSFDSKVDQMKLKKQAQEIIFKPSSSMNKLHLMQLKQSTNNILNTPKSPNNFNVIQVNSARQQL